MKLLFKIVQLKKELLDLPIEKMRQFPVHENELHHAHEFMLLYTFKPSRSCDVEKYKEYLKNHFKKHYNAYSVEVSDVELLIN